VFDAPNLYLYMDEWMDGQLDSRMLHSASQSDWNKRFQLALDIFLAQHASDSQYSPQTVGGQWTCRLRLS